MREGTEVSEEEEEKEEISRLSSLYGREARRKARKEKRRRTLKRTVLILLVMVCAALLLGGVLDVPYLNAVREAGGWLKDRFNRSPDEDGGATGHDYAFLRHPQTGRTLSGEASVLFVLHMGDWERTPLEIMGMALFTLDVGEGRGEIYLVPEETVAYNEAGEKRKLRGILREKKGEEILRSTVENMTGMKVDYMVLCEFWQAVRIVQALESPPVEMPETIVLVNTLNGETEYLIPGQRIADADRLLLYHLATDITEVWEDYYYRRDRLRDYLPGLLQAMAEPGAALSGLLADWPQGKLLRLEPGTGSGSGDLAYLVSMLRAFRDLPAEKIYCRAVPMVEVLNGCGVPGLGKKVGDRLLSLGVPLSGTAGNAKKVVDGQEVNDFSYQKSVIVCHNVDPRVQAYARFVGVLLSVSEVRVEPASGPEVVVIAGKDMAD